MIRIVDCKYGFAEDEAYIITAKYEEDGMIKYMTFALAEGFPNFYMTEEDIHDRMIELDESEDFIALINRSYVDEIEGAEVNSDNLYEVICGLMDNKKDLSTLGAILLVGATCSDEILENIIEKDVRDIDPFDYFDPDNLDY